MSHSSHLPVADLAQNRPNPFELTLSGDDCAALARDLDLLGLRKVRLAGKVVAEGTHDWRLTGRLGATVVQPCVVTLAPVTTRIEVDIERRLVRDFVLPGEPEAEMPEDDTVDPLGAEIDLAAILAESLALNLPLYPRAAAADLGEAVFTEPGKTAMRDEDARPFAALSGLRDALKDKE